VCTLEHWYILLCNVPLQYLIFNPFVQDDTEDSEANDIVYDEKAIEQLLDRSQEGIEEKVGHVSVLLYQRH
jgi:hypothetical protein